MFYEKYLRLKGKLADKQQRNLTRINQSVSITELLVRADKIRYSFGEAKKLTSNKSKIPLQQRLKDHIQILMAIGQQYHEDSVYVSNTAGVKVMQPQARNHVTRLSTPEFFLYPKDKPLTQKAFIELIEHIEKLATSSHPNLHFLLSSFPVIVDDAVIANYVVYVQCGTTPSLNVIAKSVASNVDVTYPHYSNYRLVKTPDKYDDEMARYAGLFSLKNNNIIIPHESLVEAETVGGAKFTTAVDICFDNALKHSKYQFIQKKANKEQEISQHFIPEQVSHIVTSNSIVVTEQESLLSHIVTHVDANVAQAGVYHTATPHQRSITSQHPAINTPRYQTLAATLQYPKTAIETQPGYIHVTHPPFGGAYTVTCHQTYALERLSGEALDDVTYINRQLAQRQLRQTLDNRFGTKAVLAELEHGDDVDEDSELDIDLPPSLFATTSPKKENKNETESDDDEDIELPPSLFSKKNQP